MGWVILGRALLHIPSLNVFHVVLCFQAMRTSWHIERVMALTPPTGGRVQVHGTGNTLHFTHLAWSLKFTSLYEMTNISVLMTYGCDGGTGASIQFLITVR